MTLCGNLTARPELKQTKSGVDVANFSVAQTPAVFNNETRAWENLESVFTRCVAWQGIAKRAAELSKGQRVLVYGKLRAKKYTNRDGEERRYQELEVLDMGPSLKFGQSKHNQGSAATGWDDEPPF